MGSRCGVGSAGVAIVRWRGVVTGGGTDECYGGPVSLHVRVSQNGTDWSGWATTEVMIGDPPPGTHPTPTFSAPPLTSIPYTATTPFALTVTSTQVFTSWEYKQACWDAFLQVPNQRCSVLSLVTKCLDLSPVTANTKYKVRGRGRACGVVMDLWHLDIRSKCHTSVLDRLEDLVHEADSESVW